MLNLGILNTLESAKHLVYQTHGRRFSDLFFSNFESPLYRPVEPICTDPHRGQYIRGSQSDLESCVHMMEQSGRACCCFCGQLQGGRNAMQRCRIKAQQGTASLRCVCFCGQLAYASLNRLTALSLLLARVATHIFLLVLFITQSNEILAILNSLVYIAIGASFVGLPHALCYVCLWQLSLCV